MEAEESSSSFQYTTTEKHVEDWFEENQWWVEDLDDRNKIKLAQLFYIYQVYESMRNISIIPQDAEQRKKFAFCLLDKMGFTIKNKSEIESSLNVMNPDPKDKNIYTLSPFFLTSKDGEKVLKSFTRFPVINREHLSSKKKTIVDLKKMIDILKKKRDKEENIERRKQLDKELEGSLSLLTKAEEELYNVTKASLTASYATPTPAATISTGVVTSHALSDVDINKLTNWFVNVDKTIDIFKEVYLNSNESKSILNAFVYFIVMGKNLGDNEAQGVKAKIRTFMEDTTREDGAVNEWVTMLLQTPDEAQLTRMLSYNVFDKYFDSVKSLLDENIADAKKTLILKLVESLYKFVIYDEVKTHKNGKSMEENKVEEKVNNIFEVQQIIKNPENFNKMKLFDVIMREGSFEKIHYSMIKQSYDDIEDLYAKLEQRYTNKTDNNDIKKNIANNYYNLLKNEDINIDIDKFKLLEKLYGEFTDKDFKTKTGDIKEVKQLFYENTLQMYVDLVGTRKENLIPYEVKFLYDIVYFAHIQCRPDIFDIKHETMLDYETVWNSKVPYVANLNNFYEDEEWYYYFAGSWGTKQKVEDVRYNSFLKVCKNHPLKVDDKKKEISKIYSYSLSENTMTIKEATINNNNNDDITVINTLITALSKMPKNDDIQKRINLLYCMLSDYLYDTKFVNTHERSGNLFTSMIQGEKNDYVTVPQASIKDLSYTINWGKDNLNVPYPKINFPGRITQDKSTDGNKINRKKSVYYKMDGTTLKDITKAKEFSLIQNNILLLLVVLLYMKSKTIASYYEDYKELPLYELMDDKQLNSFAYKEIKVKITPREDEYDVVVKSHQKGIKDETKYILSQKEINDFNAIHTTWDKEQNKLSGNTSIEPMIINVRELLKTLKTSKRLISLEIDVYLSIWKTLRRFQPIIDKHGYDNFKVRYMSTPPPVKEKESDGGKEGEEKVGEDDPSFTTEFVYNVLLAVGYIYRKSESQLNYINKQLTEKRINNTPFKIEIQNNQSNTNIKVIETGFMYNSIRAEVIIPHGMISDKEFTTFYISEKVPVKTHNVEHLTEELLQRYIWNVSFQVQDKRRIQEITTIDKLKSFLTPTRIIVAIVIMVCLAVALDSLNGAYIDYKYGEIPEFFRLQVPQIVKQLPDSTKTLIKEIVNPLIESKSCSVVSSETCKVSLRDTVDNLIKEGKLPWLYDNVVYTTQEQMKSVPSKIEGINLFDYVKYYWDMEFSGGIGRQNFVGRADGTRKSIKAARKRSCKEYKLKKSKKVKAMLRRSARIQAQAKKLRKSLKKRRCDGTSDLFSTCYVNKTAY